VHESKTSLRHIQEHLPSGYRVVGHRDVRILSTPAGTFPARGEKMFDARGLPKDHLPGDPTDAGTLYRDAYAYTSELVADFYTRRLLGTAPCESCIAVGISRWMTSRGLLLHIKERRKCLSIIEQAMYTIGGVTRHRVEPFFSPKPPPPKRTRTEKDEILIQRAQNRLLGVQPDPKVLHPCRSNLRDCVLGYLLEQFGFPKYFHNAPSRIWCP
jgi:hypothetical protein